MNKGENSASNKAVETEYKISEQTAKYLHLYRRFDEFTYEIINCMRDDYPESVADRLFDKDFREPIRLMTEEIEKLITKSILDRLCDIECYEI